MNVTVSRDLYEHVMVPNYAPVSVVPVDGRGARVWDQDGTEYIDFAVGIADNALGHCHQELVESLTLQAQRHRGHGGHGRRAITAVVRPG